MFHQPLRLRRTLVVSLALITSALFMPAAHADKPWPVKPIQLVIPYPPGGSADLLGRPLALQLQQQLESQELPYLHEHQHLKHYHR